ncbi:hypothetical protein N7532_001997 [Penicillium argentinense]|uniref:Uncharacterized protein n=1 Tax=Penicillium argentinense TaxID=1131581 RepID=A0A9W9K6G3_9EURO|nr:uncharacterized protein N7532_010227 [Penicillium argentinense]XP_056473068.1 uncharacterized protein N7532_007209 [Penicillium argentinense]XP_056479532.1 uncharacterized protein N7532_001997 [Penicillium argentinense]KAJ5085456.1 hypothetical protein N7532_010227 [Penicillium argentinense]KAJ5094918.1 hypothetical protein N7532_007209 [Penicillium argentinense]KAJ5111462.1 hypothetical protein N7532_001997 [Penicillium argentinense]
MPKYKTADTYLWYTTMKKEDILHELDMPVATPQEANTLIIHPGELLCRYYPCANMNRFQNTNALKAHIRDKHNEICEGEGGGSITAERDAAAIAFYNDLKSRYDTRVASAPQPAFPLKRDGTINMSELKRQAMEMGVDVPCEQCKLDNVSRRCCSHARRTQCDIFEEFAPYPSDTIKDP